ncbi:MAG TPA: hypothetical protein VEI94_03355 [Candidatus Bathyarchaeia archaeon]|nr:hypothetical protein [Candidatus Bathyarchaeia archaeon]
MCRRSSRRAAGATLALALLIGCAATERADRGGKSEVALADLGRTPEAFTGRTVVVQGWLVASGGAEAGAWVDMAVSDEAWARAEKEEALAGDTVRLVLTGGPSPEALQALHGNELRLVARVEGPETAEGRPALRATAIYLMARSERPQPAAARPRTTFFRDPQIGSSTSQPRVRFSFLDPAASRPTWYRQGPVAIDRSGANDSPLYNFRTQLVTEEGARRDSLCAFSTDAGNLRSVSYDESVYDPAGKQLEAPTHLDFQSGKFMDKVSGSYYPWPKNIYAAPCLGFALLGVPFVDQQVVSFYLWSEFDPATPMDVVVDGTEQVSVPAGDFECYRVRMNVNQERILRDLALPEAGYDVARAVMAQSRQPDTLLWFTTAWPHVVVKSLGRMGPPSTSPVLTEAVGLDPPTRAILERKLTAPPS